MSKLKLKLTAGDFQIELKGSEETVRAVLDDICSKKLEDIYDVVGLDYTNYCYCDDDAFEDVIEVPASKKSEVKSEIEKKVKTQKKSTS
ncbi:MAG: hypothetical protein RBR05_07270 [Candidatus Methanomethylophilaceae archaeon]|nr:hypothetical protein [Candidatus Methanomethylophilaceae archaeon]MDD3378722.1 hypothetical protein [Candidatus Methanomethylophilaceae archaeon]MDY0225169.1 hypothetical protein [Candidatus Methanomethylophilaceae archaeon]